jgi:GNAT superfamily N-acetyltransferase
VDEVLARFDRQLRREPPWPGVEHAAPVVRVVTDAWKGVLWSDLQASTADQVIEREIARFGTLGEWEWKLYSYDRPADLGARLLAAGFVPEKPETLLVATIADLDLGSDPPPGVELLPVVDEAGVGALVRVHEEVFGGEYGGLGRALVADLAAGRAAAVVAMAGGRPISSGRIEFNEGTEFASLYGGGTLPEWRRRGVFRSLVSWRAAQAAARGFRYLQTDASDDSNPILQRLGFRPLATTTPYVRR